MKYLEKMSELSCFTREDIVAVTQNPNTASFIINSYLKKGYIERVKHNLYATISLETLQPISSKFHIGCSIFDDCCLTHHSAFEYYGYANQVFSEIYVASESRFKDFEYNGVTYHRIEGSVIRDTVRIGKITVSTTEQAVVDSIADYEKIAGIEETLRCIEMIPSLDEEKLLSVLSKKNVGFVWQKCGFILEHYADTLNMSDSFFKECEKHIVSGKKKLIRGSQNNIYSKKWNLYVPESLSEITGKGVDEL